MEFGTGKMQEEMWAVTRQYDPPDSFQSPLILALSLSL
jgi:hypothetical protein